MIRPSPRRRASRRAPVSTDGITKIACPVPPARGLDRNERARYVLGLGSGDHHMNDER